MPFGMPDLPHSFHNKSKQAKKELDANRPTANDCAIPDVTSGSCTEIHLGARFLNNFLHRQDDFFESSHLESSEETASATLGGVHTFNAHQHP